MINVLFQKKRRGVNVKGKPKLLENIFLVMLVILDVYLLNLNISINDYEVKNKINSTANYINIEELIASNAKYQTSVLDYYEEIKDELKEEIVVETIVYDGLTLKELSEKLNRSLNSTISGKGDLIASYSLEKDVDPYMATAIILHETGCKWNCSYLVNTCNNVGGQKGTGCGSYSYFNNLDEGIKAFIDNLARNYISYGLTTPEAINPKYAEDPNWSQKVNKYIESIKAQ